MTNFSFNASSLTTVNFLISNLSFNKKKIFRKQRYSIFMLNSKFTSKSVINLLKKECCSDCFQIGSKSRYFRQFCFSREFPSRSFLILYVPQCVHLISCTIPTEKKSKKYVFDTNASLKAIKILDLRAGLISTEPGLCIHRNSSSYQFSSKIIPHSSISIKSTL